MTTAIISYDDTLNDHDALALGRVLADAGASLTLAYVRHTTQVERTREQLDQHDAEAVLERGARWLGDIDAERRVIVSASTGEGLKQLAAHDETDIVVFGSDYRTSPGHVNPQHSTQSLLEGGTAAIAIAPANYRAKRGVEIHSVGVLDGGDEAALQTARALAAHFNAVLTTETRHVDLLVVGSRAEAPHGRVMVSSRSQNAIEDATAPVLVVARGIALEFHAPLAVY